MRRVPWWTDPALRLAFVMQDLGDRLRNAGRRFEDQVYPSGYNRALKIANSSPLHTAITVHLALVGAAQPRDLERGFTSADGLGEAIADLVDGRVVESVPDSAALQLTGWGGLVAKELQTPAPMAS